MPLVIDITEELFNNETYEFSYRPVTTLTLEHSLISISKWEAKWHISYLSTKEKTPEQILDYIQCMCIKGDAKIENLNYMTREDLKKIVKYIEDPMTASTVNPENDKHNSDQFITSELIYSWMVGYQIPVEFEKWHINRLMMLISIIGEQNKKPTKKSTKDILAKQKAINERNRAKFKSKG